jgi:hypothetical protein
VDDQVGSVGGKVSKCGPVAGRIALTGAVRVRAVSVTWPSSQNRNQYRRSATRPSISRRAVIDGASMGTARSWMTTSKSASVATSTVRTPSRSIAVHTTTDESSGSPEATPRPNG